MTDEQKLVWLKTVGAFTDSDDILLSYLHIAESAVLNRAYPFVNDRTNLKVPHRYESTQINIAVYLLNKRGAEGETQHSENNVSRYYGNAYIPYAMIAEIQPMCGLPE